jgi:hypothetical protein
MQKNDIENRDKKRNPHYRGTSEAGASNVSSV